MRKVAIIGSRSLKPDDFEEALFFYLPLGTTEIVTGGARGIDTCAREYAIAHGIALREFLPDYQRYKRGAPMVRNRQIVDYSDIVLAFWDGKSRGTGSVIKYAMEIHRTVRIIKYPQAKS